MEVTGIRISGPERSDQNGCEKVLRALPEWFGIEEAIVQYVKDIRHRDTFHAYLNGCLAGFLSLTRHNAVSAEIHVMGVLPDKHRKGLGSALIRAAEEYLGEDGVEVLQVKTLGESHSDRNYALTRRFYSSQGFIPLEEILDFWGKGLPTLFMVKFLQ